VRSEAKLRVVERLANAKPREPKTEDRRQVDLSQLSVYAVPAHELQAWWPVVRPALEEVKRKNNPSWIPEDVYHCIKQGIAWLALTLYGRDVIGVTVTCRDGDQFANATDMLVWIAWADPKNVARGIDEAGRVLTQKAIEDAARAAGFRVVRMHSPRLGWLKVAPKLGYRMQEIVWVKSLR
jgi:hypothetical protein